MKYIATISGKQIPVGIERKGGKFQLTIGDRSFTVDSIRTGPQSLSLIIDGLSCEVGLERAGNSYTVHFFDHTVDLELVEEGKFHASEIPGPASHTGPVRMPAPMPGKIVKVNVHEGDRVQEGQSLIIMEAMKMQNDIKAPRSGVVSRIHAKEGEPVSMSQILVVLE